MRRSVQYVLDEIAKGKRTRLATTLDKTGADLCELGKHQTKFELFVELFANTDLNSWSIQEWAGIEVAWDRLNELGYFDIYTPEDKNKFGNHLRELGTRPAKGVLSYKSLRYDPHSKYVTVANHTAIDEIGRAYGFETHSMVACDANNKLQMFIGDIRALFRNQAHAEYGDTFSGVVASNVTKIVRMSPVYRRQFDDIVNDSSAHDLFWSARIRFEPRAFDRYDEEDEITFTSIIDILRNDLAQSLKKANILVGPDDIRGINWKW